MKSQPDRSARQDPGVPEALPRTLVVLAERLGVETLDRLWLFPPLVRGRREWGLVAASRFQGEGERRALVTVRYEAERTGAGLAVTREVEEQGEAPPDSISRIIAGVVQRSDEALGEPRSFEIGGERDRFDALLGEFDADLFDRRPDPEPDPEPDPDPGPEPAAEPEPAAGAAREHP